MRHQLLRTARYGLLFVLFTVAAWATAPTISSTSPTTNALNVSATSNITITFDQSMDNATLTSSTIKVFGNYRGYYTGAFSYGANSVTINPDSSFKPGEVITVTVTTGVKNPGNEPMTSPRVFNFTVDASAGYAKFRTPVSYTAYGTGSGNHYSALADLDMDGDIDIASTISLYNIMSVMLNNGDGTYASAVTYTTLNAFDISAADVDGDGDMDLLVANNNAFGISVFVNNGSGSFSTRNDYDFDAFQSNAQFLVTVDIDGDGDIDVVTSDLTNNYLHVMKNNGSGVFSSTGTDFEFTTRFGALAYGDLDKDGDMDIAASCSLVDSVEYFVNDGTGNLSLQTRFYWTNTDGPTDVLVADINSTSGNKQDLVYLSGTGEVLTYFKNNFTTLDDAAEVSVGGYPIAVKAADIDTDSDLDLLVANYNDATFSLLTNTGSGTGTFTQTTYTIPDNPDDLSTADLDGDGDMDIVTINNDATVSVFSNYNGAHVSSVTPANGSLDQSVSSNVVIVFDENIDSGTLTSSTVKLIGSVTGVHAWTLSSYVAGTYTATIDPTADFVPGEVVTVTVNTGVQNGNAVALEKGYSSQFVVAAGNGAAFDTKTDYAAGTQPKSIILTDLNADGDPDFVAVNSGSDNVSVRLNNGDGTYGSETLLSTGDNPTAVAAGDVDGDGDIDLVVTVTNANQLARFLNNGSGVFGSATTYSTSTGPIAITLSDIDGDGDLDAVYSNGSALRQKNDGTGAFSDEWSLSSTDVGVVVADVDNDGDMDIIGANENTTLSNIYVGYNSGSGTWNTLYSGSNTYSTGHYPTGIVAVDFSGDGYVDIVTSNLALGNGAISYHQNNQNGTFAAKVDYTVATSAQPRGITAMDIDGDGDMDVVAANGAGDAAKVFINDGSAIFSDGGQFTTGDNPYAIASADADGDGLMDIATANYDGGSVSVLMNVLAAPTVTTSAATSITSTGATLNGIVNANNLTTAAKFAYKLSSSGTYADTIVATPTGFAGGGNTAVSAALSGLLQNTMYDFKAVGINATGTSEGSALNFTTLEDALVVSSTTPSANALDVDTAANITVTFNISVEADSLNADNVKVYGSFSGPIAGAISYDDPSKTMTFNPTGYFRAGEIVSITLTDNIASNSALSFLTPATYSFSAAATGSGPGFFNLTTVASHFSKYESRFLSADVDNDGDADLVGWSYNEGFTVSKNNGSGFDAPVSNGLANNFSTAQSLKYGDIDGDGYGDLIAARSNNSTYIVILKNNGTGSFSLYDSINTSSTVVYYGLEVKDFNNDGKMDIAYYANSASQFVIAYNSTGWTNTDSYSITAGGYQMTSGDVDNDGDIDLVFVNGTQISVLKNNGNETFASAVNYTFTSFSSSLQEVFLKDFNGDGNLDVMTSGSSPHQIAINLNNGDGTFGSETLTTLSIHPAVGSTGDLDGDGDIDLAFVYQNETVMNVAYNNGSGVFSQQALFNFDMPGLTVMDYDNDGDLDIIGSDYSTSTTLNILTNSVPTAPSTSASGVNITNDYGSQFKVNWTNGSGNGRIVVMKEGSAVSWTPTDDVTYTANASFGSGSDLGDGSYVVYNGASTSVTVTNLSVSTTYHVAVYEYNGLSGIEKYKTTTPGTTSDQTSSAAGYPFDTTAGNALTFGGIWNQTNNSFTLGSAFTIEAWVKPASIGSMTMLVHGSDYMWIGMDGTGKFTGMVYDADPDANVSITGTSTAVANQWYHITLTAANGSPLKLYVNGVLEATSGGNLISISGWSDVIYLGGDYNNASYDGDLDEIRLWSDIRTEEEIRTNMFKTLSGIPDNLVSYWQLNEGSTNSSEDIVGNNPMVNYDDLVWVASGAPVGSAAISSSSVAASDNGPHTIGNAELTMTDGFDNPVDVLVSELTAEPSNYPTGYGSSIGGKYFVINVFGDPGTFSTSLTLTFGAGVITTAQHNDPSLISLFKRESNSSGAWTLVSGATAADSVTGEVIWAGITSFSQFMAASSENEAPPTYTFTKANNADWTLAENQDRLTDNVWLTRADTKGLFNIKSESSYDNDGYTSPAGTEWAVGTVADTASLTFTTWREAAVDYSGGNGVYLNQDMVLHLIDDDIYLDIKFTSWTQGYDGGGFSYTRSLLDLEVFADGESNLTGTSVDINGSVYSKNATATTYVLYGTTSGSYPDSVQMTPNTIPLDTLHGVSVSLSGLTPLDTVFYVISVWNGLEYKQTSEQSFFPHDIQIWDKDNGTITFTKANNADYTQSANQDRINDDVWLTRSTGSGLFNINTENSFSSSSSPDGTEWAIGTTENYESLTFTTFYQTYNTGEGGSPADLIGQDMVVHIIDEDIYLDIKFLSWGIAGDNGYSYIRASAPLSGTVTHSSDITSTDATVYGSVYSTGYNATAKFFYGTSSGTYTDSVVTTPASIDADSLTDVSADLTTLSPGVLYYVSLKSQNDTMSHQSGEITVMTMSDSPGNSLLFDGSNDYVRISDANALDLTTSYTLEAWIKPNGFSSMAGIVSKYHSGGANGYFIRLSNNSPYTGIRFDEQESASGILTAGNWYHIAAVNDNGTRTLYVDGSPVSISGSAYTTNSNSDHVAIGSDFNGRYFNGVIDEVRIWNVARTQQQIQDNMNLPFTSVQSGLVGYWQLNAGTGSVAHGHGTDAGDGTLTNFNFDANSGWVESAAPLPVELTSFTASSIRLNAVLKWGTATELNNHGYEVERTFISDLNSKEKRSSAPKSWAKAGFVEGSGTSNAPKEYSFTDKVQKSGKYSYRLKQIDNDGKVKYSHAIEVEVGVVPKVFTLDQNYPNPFNPSTTIGFTLEQTGMATLKVYDILGREVVTLVNEVLEAGVFHQKIFDARGFASGIYFARLQSGEKTQLKKMMLLK